MAKVFVVNQPWVSKQEIKQYDISPALQYGEIVFVFQIDSVRPSVDPKNSIKHAYRILKDITKNDYILWAGGDPLGNTIVSCIACEYLNGTVKYLKWEKDRSGNTKNGYYSPVVIDFGID